MNSYNTITRSSLHLRSSTINLARRFIHQHPTQQPAKLLIFPITKQKSYVHFEYNDNLINTDSPLVKYEDKLTRLAAKGWKKITDSDKSYNKKIVHYINKFLEATPWSEDSLRSIPSTSALLRQIQTLNDQLNEKEGNTPEILLKTSTELSKLSSSTTEGSPDHKIIDIPVYYPSSLLSLEQLQNEVLHLAQQGKKYHQRQMLINAILIPFTIPFIVLPVVPNIPGFYLAYRFYCNFKAYLGAEHLQELIKQDHLKFIESSDIDAIYSDTNSSEFLNENGISKIGETFQLNHLKSILLKSVKQEAKDASKNTL